MNPTYFKCVQLRALVITYCFNGLQIIAKKAIPGEELEFLHVLQQRPFLGILGMGWEIIKVLF
jgi:hypothetical protein